MIDFQMLYPWAPLTAGLWAAQYAVKRWVPGVWGFLADIPFGPCRAKPALKIARKVWQGLPSVATGALVGALVVGQDPRDAWIGAVAGAVAPVWHEILKALPGSYGSPTT
jgi:hypothetical protein